MKTSVTMGSGAALVLLVAVSAGVIGQDIFNEDYGFSGDDDIYSYEESEALWDHLNEQGIISFEEMNATWDYFYTKEETEAWLQRIDDFVLNGDPSNETFLDYVEPKKPSGDFLFQAMIMYTDTTTKPKPTLMRCGGVLINENQVLTTASCYRENYMEELAMPWVGIGSLESDPDKIPEEHVFLWSAWEKHPDPEYDLSIITLSEQAWPKYFNLSSPTNWTDLNVEPICMPTPAQAQTFEGGRDNYIMDQRLLNFKDHGDYWLPTIYEKVSIFDKEECTRRYASSTLEPIATLLESDTVEEPWICAGPEEDDSGTCFGDGGSVLIARQSGRFYLAGVSPGGVCSEGKYPATFRSIAPALDWITSLANVTYCE